VLNPRRTARADRSAFGRAGVSGRNTLKVAVRIGIARERQAREDHNNEAEVTKGVHGLSERR
jgi:hypothetical protein